MHSQLMLTVTELILAACHAGLWRLHRHPLREPSQQPSGRSCPVLLLGDRTVSRHRLPPITIHCEKHHQGMTAPLWWFPRNHGTELSPETGEGRQIIPDGERTNPATTGQEDRCWCLAKFEECFLVDCHKGKQVPSRTRTNSFQKPFLNSLVHQTTWKISKKSCEVISARHLLNFFKILLWLLRGNVVWKIAEWIQIWPNK